MSLYTEIKVGDFIEFPKSLNPKSCALIKSGKISKVRGLNGHAKEIWTDNGGHFIASRYRHNYYLNKEVK